MEKFGLLGEQLGHSFSETIHNLFFQKVFEKAFPFKGRKISDPRRPI